MACSSSAGDVLDEKKCVNLSKPLEERKCKGSVCKNGVWLATEWTKVDCVYFFELNYICNFFGLSSIHTKRYLDVDSTLLT